MKDPNQLRILIADDHELVRRGLKALLLSKAGWVVCAEASNGREAVALATQHRPDIIVMDIAMPDLNGLEATRKIRTTLPNSEVLVLSLHYPDQHCSRNRGRGCSQLLTEIRRLHRPSDRRRSSCQASIFLYLGAPVKS